jgi:hypothetical protein
MRLQMGRMRWSSSPRMTPNRSVRARSAMWLLVMAGGGWGVDGQLEATNRTVLGPWTPLTPAV